jgi:hypothetical protein
MSAKHPEMGKTHQCTTKNQHESRGPTVIVPMLKDTRPSQPPCCRRGNQKGEKKREDKRAKSPPKENVMEKITTGIY